MISATIEINEVESGVTAITIILNSDDTLSVNNIQTKEIIAEGLDIVVDIKNLIQKTILPNFNKEGLEKIKERIRNEHSDKMEN